MKKHTLILISLVLWACDTPPEVSTAQITIPDLTVEADQVTLSQQGPKLLVDGVPFSGYLEEYNVNEKITSLTGYFEGLKEGIATQTYKSGQLKENRFYRMNKKHGTHQGWWPDGSKKYEITFDMGLTHGESKEWYSNGQLYRVFHYDKGYEIGSQKMWEENGKIRANYVVKNGHRYGLIGLKNCKSVENDEGALAAISY